MVLMSGEMKELVDISYEKKHQAYEIRPESSSYIMLTCINEGIMREEGRLTSFPTTSWRILEELRAA